MAVKWTEQQQQVIDLRKADILVSAAAGSGKTAVLVQRILSKITDPEDPVNIDQLVIVTFTQAAAGEMRERIQAAIEKEAALHPDNEHLQRQRTRIHMANISTIHSFCKSVIQNHFQEIDLEPSFRIGDEGEVKLIKQEVLGEVLEEYFASEDKTFVRFAETFAVGKNDDILESIVLDLYNFSMSDPYPVEWLSHCLTQYAAKDYEAVLQTDWMQALFAHFRQMLSYGDTKIKKFCQLVEQIPEREAYMEIAGYYRALLESLAARPDYVHWQKVLQELKHPALPRGKKSCQDEEIREELKQLRDDVKKILDSLKKDYFGQTAEEILDDLANCRPVMEKLIEITVRFMEAYRQEKRSRNLLDFNDLEHEALRILRDEKTKEPTETAREYGEFFDEILIDEYQDSNMVQEYLLTSISRHAAGEHNVFMVGDAKQSIYRFRMARPELFMEKFDTFSVSEGPRRRIDLHKNFRSRHHVLDSANYIFERLMHRELGGITYDAEAALYPGLIFPEQDTKQDYRTELLLFDKKELEGELDAVQYEAKLIAHRIRRLTDPAKGLQVLDKASGGYRRAQYGDIAILLRSTAGFDTALIEELAAEGIPAHAVSREGYFDTLEIATVLNYLRVIDNPLQDIPMLSVLKSPFVGISDEDLVRLRLKEKKTIYDCVCAYREDGEEDTLVRRLADFLEQLADFRKKMHYMPIHKFICYILDETGYGDYIAVMPGGEQRRANIQMLIEKASDFEAASYLGVFQFVRYVEQLEKYQIETGEASVVGENDNAVRIMTIHKSKGLEFPIVFLAGLGRKFNHTQARQPVVFHPTLGLGMDNVQLKSRQKNKTLLRGAILLQNQLESLGEELRVLYVALTRAREKMILTAGAEDLERAVKNAYRDGMGDAMEYGCLVSAGHYIDWILTALAGHPDMDVLAEEYMEQKPGRPFNSYEGAGFAVQKVRLDEMLEEDLQQMAENERKWLNLEEQLAFHTEELPEHMSKALHFAYPYEKEKKIPVKVSVSELKRREISQEEEAQLFAAEEPVRLRPAFLEAEEEHVSSVARGTAYHKVFECLDLEKCGDIKEIREQLESFFEAELLPEECRPVIRPEKIAAFVKSDIGQRMKRADREGRLYREQPFVYSMEAQKLDKNWDSAQPVLIQGIIDAFFEEDGALVLVDYKTDHLKGQKPQVLAERYKSQMEYYRKALESMMGKPVKEAVLYSVYLEQIVPV